MASHEVIDITTLTAVGSLSGDEQRYFCPVCPDKRGKPDREGKLYWSTLKNVGWCFLCSTAFFPQELAMEDRVPTLDGRYLAGLDRLLGVFRPSLTEPEPLPFVFADRFGVVDKELLDYLEQRNPYLPGLVRLLGIRGWFGRDKGVVLPFWYREAVVKFQTRFLYKTTPKYYTSIGQKPFYSPHQVFRPQAFDQGSIEEVTLCEGVFDAIALACMGFPTPLAMLGKTVSEFQVHLLRLLGPRGVIAALDEWQLSKDLVTRLQRHRLPSVEALRIITPWSKQAQDPEEFMVHRMTVHQGRQRYRERFDYHVTQWLGSWHERTQRG